MRQNIIKYANFVIILRNKNCRVFKDCKILISVSFIGICFFFYCLFGCLMWRNCGSGFESQDWNLLYHLFGVFFVKNLC